MDVVVTGNCVGEVPGLSGCEFKSSVLFYASKEFEAARIEKYTICKRWICCDSWDDIWNVRNNARLCVRSRFSKISTSCVCNFVRDVVMLFARDLHRDFANRGEEILECSYKVAIAVIAPIFVMRVWLEVLEN